jgi:ABC-type glycerol-3-phosphate transport system permease component
LKQIADVFKKYLILITVAVILMIPVFILVSSSLKTFDEIFTYPPVLLPRTPRWGNYIAIFLNTDFGEIATRTGTLALTFAVITTITSSIVGFAFARYRAPGSRFLFGIVIAMLIVPQIVIIIPQFIIYARLRLINTYWPWILSALAGTPLYIFLFRQFFLGFPKELEDAAEVDGCGPLRLYSSILMPNSKPAIAAVMIFAFISVWGDYFTPLIFLNPNRTLLGVALSRIWRFGGPGLGFTATVLYILPLVIVFFFAQKHVIRGVVTSGLHGS